MGNKKIKCVVWDLDNTIWRGILSEDSNVVLREGISEIIEEIDSRGILNSIASKNNYKDAIEKLREFNLDQYFIYPQINWNSKAESVGNIARSINIGIDTLAFIDDQEFEREEVIFSYPGVLCIDSEDINIILDREEFIPRFITEESRKRRLMYLSDIARNNAENAFVGPQEDFLATLGMVFEISHAKVSDLQRAEELTVRTHQLNTTGYVYSYEDLKSFIHSNKYKLLVAGLEDKYGNYGKIGLCLLECGEEIWTIKLLLMSCRVMSRGVGTVLLNHIMKTAKENNVKLQAEFVPTDRNRMMLITYKFAGFYEVKEEKDLIVFQNDLGNIQDFPEYIKVNILQ